MVGRCGECGHRWTCELSPETCGAFPDPVPILVEDEANLLQMALDDLETIMSFGGQNIDTCDYCISTTCYGRGGMECCEPKYRGQIKK